MLDWHREGCMEELSLNGQWILKRLANGSERPMTVPGDIISALVASGEAQDPYFDRNELDLQWVGREDWQLTRAFEVPETLRGAKRIFVEFASIDTLAEVMLNSQPIGTSRNMFRRFRADIASLLAPGRNELSVIIRSPEMAAIAEAQKLAYPIPASTYPASSPNRNLIRKAQCMGGWDWGPSLMTGGLYDGVAIVGHDGPRIEYVRARTRRARSSDAAQSDEWIVDLSIELDSSQPCDSLVSVELGDAGSTQRIAVAAGQSTISEELHITSPLLWWPAGYGEQNLYDLRVVVGPAAGKGLTHEARMRLGFRDLRVDALLDDIGRSMTIVVNDRAIFAKGANWIPADALPSRWARERMADLLGSAADANMNCVRVWGGGRYESDAFYELCDELGLLVWQDCMFSCALYPSSPEFLGDVEAEIRHQVRRLANHPCIALWCGNNEALGAITWYDESKSNPARYIIDYDRLTEGTLGRVVRELDPDRTWWPSSPSAGPNDFSDNWHSDSRGDMHFWSVWHEGKPFSEYMTVRPRFCSEFGFQSLPCYRTVTSFAPAGQFNISSPAMEHHQRHPRGYSIIMDTMLRYFRMPKDFRSTLYLSQVQQAIAIKAAVEFWRSNRPRCMGTLYWQLNDVWPGSSWSSIEYDGGWKLLHYTARRFFDPLLLALFIKDQVIYAYAVNDADERLRARLSLTLRRFDGSVIAELAPDAASTISAEPEAATLFWSLPVSRLPAPAHEAFIDARLTVSGSVQRRATLFLTDPKACDLLPADIKASVVAMPETTAELGGLAVRLRTKAPAFFVALSTDGIAGRFDDSGFDLEAGEERLVRFLAARSAPPITIADLSTALRVDDLGSSYE